MAVDGRFTLDSNVLVYTVDGRAGRKQEIARRVIVAAARLDCWLTLQAVSEFYAVVSRKRIVPAALAAERANDWLTAFHALRRRDRQSAPPCLMPSPAGFQTWGMEPSLTACKSTTRSPPAAS